MFPHLLERLRLPFIRAHFRTTLHLISIIKYNTFFLFVLSAYFVQERSLLLSFYKEKQIIQLTIMILEQNWLDASHQKEGVIFSVFFLFVSRLNNLPLSWLLFSQLKTFPIWVWLPGKYTGISIHDVLVNGIHIICCSPPLKYVFLGADIKVKRFFRIIRINKCIQHKALNYSAVIIGSIAYCWSWTAVDEYFNIGKWFWGELVASEFEELVIG